VELKAHYRKKEMELEATCADAVKQMEMDMSKKLSFFQRFYDATKSIEGLDEQLFVLGKSASIDDAASSDALRCLESAALLGHMQAKMEFAQRVLQVCISPLTQASIHAESTKRSFFSCSFPLCRVLMVLNQIRLTKHASFLRRLGKMGTFLPHIIWEESMRTGMPAVQHNNYIPHIGDLD
jgi:hypothetical protein